MNIELNPYITTVHGPTVVDACATGNFTSSTELNLILARNNYLEIYLKTTDFEFLKKVQIDDRIAGIKTYRLQKKQKDFLFVITRRCNIMILEYVDKDKDVNIKAKTLGQITDPPKEYYLKPIQVELAPEAQVICLRFGDTNDIRIISLDAPTLQAYRVCNYNSYGRLQVFNLLYGYKKPNLITVYSKNVDDYIKIIEIPSVDSKSEKEIWSRNEVGQLQAKLVIPVHTPFYGAIIIGVEKILYINHKDQIFVETPDIKDIEITCYTKADDEGLRYLFANEKGQLFKILLVEEKDLDSSRKLHDLEVELLGEINPPTCMAYLENDTIFVGSREGDSQFIRINWKTGDGEPRFKIIYTLINLTSVVDAIVLDSLFREQTQIIMRTDNKKNEIITIDNYKNFRVYETFPISTVERIWTLKLKGGDFTDTLVLSSCLKTRCIDLNCIYEKYDDYSIPALNSYEETHYIANITNDLIILVTKRFAKLFCLINESDVSLWKPPKRSITGAAGDDSNLLCVCTNELYHIQIENRELVLKAFISLDFDVTCLYMYPLGNTIVVAVGLSDASIRIFTLPDFKEIHKKIFENEILPKSLLITSFGDNAYLFCAQENGNVYYFSLNAENGTLSDRTDIFSGIGHVSLRSYQSNVYICSRKSAVIYLANDELVLSYINFGYIHDMCLLNSEKFPNSLVLTNREDIKIGTMDEIGSTHIMKFWLEKCPMLFAHQDTTRTFGIITFPDARRKCSKVIKLLQLVYIIDYIPLPSNAVTQIHKNKNKISESLDVNEFHIIDQCTEIIQYVHTFEPCERPKQLISARLGQDSSSYFVVIMDLLNTTNHKPTNKICLYNWAKKKIRSVAEKKIEYNINSVIEFNGKLLVYNNFTLQIFNLTKNNELQLKCTPDIPYQITSVKVKRDLILIHDGESFIIFRYRNEQNKFEEICRRNFTHISDAEIITDKTFLFADEKEIYLCRISDDNKNSALQILYKYYSDDEIKSFWPCPSDVNRYQEFVLFSTNSGAIGLITFIPQVFYKSLREKEDSLNKSMKRIGDIEHCTWMNSFRHIDLAKKRRHDGFIDGDLIESFQNLSQDQKSEGANGRKSQPPEDIINIVKYIRRVRRIKY